jgi:hypothetical protein
MLYSFFWDVTQRGLTDVSPQPAGPTFKGRAVQAVQQSKRPNSPSSPSSPTVQAVQQSKQSNNPGILTVQAFQQSNSRSSRSSRSSPTVQAVQQFKECNSSSSPAVQQSSSPTVQPSLLRTLDPICCSVTSVTPNTRCYNIPEDLTSLFTRRRKPELGASCSTFVKIFPSQ